MLRCWWVEGCRQPQDNAEMGVAVPQAYPQVGRPGGKLLCPVVLLPIVTHLLLVVIALLPKPQIVFESHLVNDIRNDCLMTIDGTDFKILQKGAKKKGNVFSSHKYAGKSVLRYELATSSQGIWSGSRGLTLQVCGRILRFL
jgi:hypothetical protein